MDLTDQHGRLERLWKLACHYQYVNPRESRYFCQSILRTCRDASVSSSSLGGGGGGGGVLYPANAFYQVACARCGNIYTFGKTCRARLERLSRLRKACRNGKTGDKGQINFASAVLFTNDEYTRPKASSLVMVYECLVCHSRMVFDTHSVVMEGPTKVEPLKNPVELPSLEEEPPKVEESKVVPPGPRTLTKAKPATVSKTEQLRKLLAKKAKPAASDEGETNLHSFLKSLKKT